MAEYTDNYGLIEPTYAELADIDPLNRNFETIDEIMHASQVSLADAYDLTATYNTGDVVMYQYLMYKCKEDNVTGAWDAEKWERTTAGANGSGGGGTEVVANPVGTPTADLQTIEIAGTIYDIPGGGGSGGGGAGISIESLWSGINSATMQLSKSFEDYDAITVIATAVTAQGDYRLTNTWPVEYLKQHINDGIRFGLTGDTWYVYFSITNNTTFTRQDQSIVYISDILGVKFAGSGAVSAEVIPIGIGDGTYSRTFQLNRTPKSIIMQGYTSGDGGWYESGYFIWGSEFINLVGAQRTMATGGYAGQAAISYGADGKSFTITAANAFGAFNRADSFSGFLLVDYGEGGGSDGDPSEFLPHSKKSNIICEATLENFDAGALNWGDGDNPIILSQNVSKYNNEAVLIPVATNGTLAYVDILGNKNPFTAYIVCKAQTAGQYTRLLSALETHNNNQGPMIFGTNNINIGSWGNSTPTGIIATSDYVVCAIQYIGYGIGYCKVNGGNLSPFPITGSNRYITIGRTDTGNGGDQEPCDILVKYFGVVEGVDTHKTIIENVSNLMSKFGIS